MLNEARSILLGLFIVFFCTKNGRNLMLKTIRNVAHLVPISLRRFILSNSWRISNKLNRKLLYLTTKPIGKENEWIHKVKKDNWEGTWIGPNLKGVKNIEEIVLNQDIIIYFIHGGGFSLGYSTMYMESFQLIIQTLLKNYGKRAIILSLEYSLSPEQVWPKACYESIDCYTYLLHELGIQSSKIIFLGDSAGGNLIASTLLILNNQRSNEKLKELPPISLPAGAALISPWIDLTPLELLNQSTKQDTLSLNLLSKFSSQYLTDKSSIKHQYVSPFYGDFNSNMRPLFISFGEKEILKETIELFISDNNNNNNITVLKGENESHIWLISSLMATSKQVYYNDINTLIKWISNLNTL